MKHTIRLIIVGLSAGILFILSLAVVLAYEWPELIKQYPIPANSSNDATQQVDTSDWLTYKNEELGITFDHPSNVEVRTRVFDGCCDSLETTTGRKISLEFFYRGTSRLWENMSMVALTPVYADEIGEGTPRLYVGPTINTNDLHQLNSFLNNHFLATTYPERIEINGNTGISFYYLYNNIGSEYNFTYLFPLRAKIYANLQVVTPYSYSIEGVDNYASNGEAQLKLKFYSEVESNQIRKNQEFERIIRSIRWL